MKRLKNAVITRIALCKQGRNRLPVLYKADGGEGEIKGTATLAKFDEDKGELLAVVYPADYEDKDGHAASRDEVAQMAHSFMQHGEGVEINHFGDVLPKDKAYVAESFLVQPGDARFADLKDLNGKLVDVDGAWAVQIQIDDPALRAKYGEQGWNGVSLFGDAEFEEAEPLAKADGSVADFFQRLADRLGGEPQRTDKDTDMNEADTIKLVKASITDALTEAGLVKKPDEQGKEQNKDEGEARPVFKGDMTDATALETYTAELAAWSFRERLAKAEPNQIPAIVAEMREAQGKQPSDEDVGIQSTDTAETKELRRRLFKSEQASRQSGDPADDKNEREEISKAELDDAPRRWAILANGGDPYAKA